MRRIFAILIVAIIAVGVKAETEVDSVSTAFATVWGEYLAPQVQRAYNGDSLSVVRFMDGMKAAMTVAPADEPYYRGVMEGIVVAQRIKQVQRMELPVDEDAFLAALGGILNGKSSGFTRESADEYLNSYVARHMEPDTVSVASQEAYLAQQRERQGVVVTPSGLHFEVLEEGEGASPELTDRVVVKYVGRLADGTVFDSTEEPVTFDVNRLVKGFTEGLTMMKPGGRYRMFIPASLGYGSRGVDGVIPGNAALDFEVELIGIN